jgi:hypothetical protein
MHTSSWAINFIFDSHTSRYNFETFKGRANERPRVFPDRGEGRVGMIIESNGARTVFAFEKEGKSTKCIWYDRTTRPYLLRTGYLRRTGLRAVAGEVDRETDDLPALVCAL